MNAQQIFDKLDRDEEVSTDELFFCSCGFLRRNRRQLEEEIKSLGRF